MWLLYMLLQQRHTVPGNATALEYLGLTTAVASGTCSQVGKFINHLHLTGPIMGHLWNWVNVSNTLDFDLSLVHLQAQPLHSRRQISKAMEQLSQQRHIFRIMQVHKTEANVNPFPSPSNPATAWWSAVDSTSGSTKSPTAKWILVHHKSKCNWPQSQFWVPLSGSGWQADFWGN